MSQICQEFLVFPFPKLHMLANENLMSLHQSAALLLFLCLLNLPTGFSSSKQDNFIIFFSARNSLRKQKKNFHLSSLKPSADDTLRSQIFTQKGKT